MAFYVVVFGCLVLSVPGIVGAWYCRCLVLSVPGIVGAWYCRCLVLSVPGIVGAFMTNSLVDPKGTDNTYTSFCAIHVFFYKKLVYKKRVLDW